MWNSILKDNSLVKIFINHEDVLLEAEALAMRALCILICLRMFAPAHQDNEDHVRYRETLWTGSISAPTKEIMEKVLKKFEWGRENVRGKWWSDFERSYLYLFREKWFYGESAISFNYWAVSALKARVYLYMGDTENANHYAMKVIEESPSTWVSETM